MKKLVIFIFGILFLSLIFANSKAINIDNEVIREINETNNVPVLIELKNPTVKPEVVLDHDFGKIVSAEISDAELKKLQKDSNVESIRPIPEKKIFLTESVPLVNGTPTWSLQVSGINLTGIDETVCILDTGANFSHPDLLGKNKTNVIDCTSGSCAENSTAPDGNGHGTHVAGIIGANGTLKGLAPEAGLIAVRVCTPGSWSCFDDDIRAGLDWCIANRNVYNISVISMSLGSTTLYSSYCDYIDDPFNLTFAINNATFYNISVIVATGNDANFTSIASPACIQNSTSVGDVYDANVGGLSWGSPTICSDASTFADKLVCHSNRNSIIDLLAPGALVNSTWKDGAYSVQGGTSMATPHVAAAFVLIRQFQQLSNQPIPTPSTILSVLNSTGKNISDSSSGLNFSRIDVHSAILYLNSTNPTSALSVALSSPANNSFTNSNLTTFNCSSQTRSNLVLKNATFYLWNSSNVLLFNESKNISGTLNQSAFNFTFISDGIYYWNCLAADNSSNSTLAGSNFSLTYDSTSPSINLISPDDAYSATGTTSVNFDFNVSESNLANCSLIVDNVTDQTNSSVNISLATRFTKSLSSGSYVWKINCADMALNEANSSSRAITINAVSVQSSGSGGGGGASVSLQKEKKIVLSEAEIFSGVSVSIGLGDRANFNVAGTPHSLKLNKINNTHTELSLSSTQIVFSLLQNESKKFDLNNDNFYDLKITLNSIRDLKANLSILKINESIPSRKLFDSSAGSANGSELNVTERSKPRLDQLPTFLGRIIILIILAVLIISFLVIHASKNK